MPIVHILLGKANPNRANGVNKVVNELARSQHQLGEQVAVWGITPSPEAPTVARCYPIRFFQAHRNPFKVDGQLIKALHEVNPTTVFHLHGGFIPAFFALHKWLVRLNLRFIFTPHGSYNHAALSKSSLRKTLYFNCFERSMVNHAKALHLIGKSELESSHQLPITAAKVLVPNGQNLEDLQFKFEAIGSTEGPVFSFCGRLKTKVKGLDLLLRGFSSFFKASGKGQLWLIGDGPDRQELEAMATELGIANQVVFWGARFGEEKLNLLANSDAFFHPSRYEGLPTAVLEASGLALPVVVSEATNLAEAVAGSQAGYVLQSNTCESIHKACFEILEDKTTGDLKKKGQNGRLMVASRFSWKQISQELIHIYND